MNVWVSSYLFYNGSLDYLLVNAVEPFVEELRMNGTIAQYFFIRYWEEGQHVRLRLLLNDNNRQLETEKKLEEYFSNFFKYSSTIDKGHSVIGWIKHVDYIPESLRYGGEKAIKIAERQFSLSSEITMNILQREVATWSYSSAMGFSIKMHLCFMRALGFENSRLIKLASFIYENFLPSTVISLSRVNENYQHNISEIKNQIQISFKSQEKIIFPAIEEFWNSLTDADEKEGWKDKWIEGFKKVINDLYILQGNDEIKLSSRYRYLLLESKEKEVTLWSIFLSYAHMTNNRLGIRVVDEAYIFYIIHNFFHKFSNSFF